MAEIMESIHKFGNRFDQCAERFTFHHPYLAVWAMFIIMPILILLAVSASTFILTLPVAWICGWV